MVMQWVLLISIKKEKKKTLFCETLFLKLADSGKARCNNN